MEPFLYTALVLAVAAVGLVPLLRHRGKDGPIPLPFDEAELALMTTGGYVSQRQHPDDPELLILNYTPKAAYERAWNDVTMNCRGLIVRDGAVVARPFKKFFNLGEMETIPDGPFISQRKMDGSLGIVYLAPDGMPAVATRGSFVSDQAQWATSWLRADGVMVEACEEFFDQGLTPLVEIIYPENRIVVDYQGKMSLTFLTALDNATGLDVDDHGITWPDDVATSWTSLDLETLEKWNAESKGEDSEGFVIRWEDGTRAKVKAEEYLRLHRILTGVTPRKIHEMLATNMGIDRLAEFVPDEFFQWMKAEAGKIEQAYSDIEKECFAVLAQVDLDADRKTQAEFINSQPHPGIVFKMLDRKDYSEQIWKMVRPAGDTAFRVDVDA